MTAVEVVVPELTIFPDDINVLRNTNAWDHEFDLPLFPEHDNSALYFAYCLRVYRPKVTSELKRKVMNLNMNCFGGRQRIRSGNPISHDEVLGWIYINWYCDTDYHKEMIMELFQNGGNLNKELNDGLSKNYFRIAEIQGLCMASIGWRVGPFDQILYGLQLVLSAFKKRGQWSSPLRSWLSIPLMHTNTIAAPFILLFNVLMFIQGKKLHTALLEYHPNVKQLSHSARYLKLGWI
jgi:hypothetical protein